MAPYKSLLASRTFTFLVGPEREAIDVHINLLQSLSEPFDKLMNNGQMKESTEKVAVIEDVDVETFGLFTEFCYRGNYSPPPKTKAAEVVGDGHDDSTDTQMTESESSEISLPTRFCYACGTSSLSTIPNGKMNCSGCKDIRCYCVLCGIRDAFPKLCQGGGPICMRCSTKTRVRRHNSLMTGAALWQRLKAKKYGAVDMSHDELRARLQSLKPEDEPSEKLVYHAKLYVFAAMYMVQSLKELCLHKLSRDLEVFNFKDHSAGDFAELFRYVYVNTSGDEDDTIATGSELRDLVVTYAACEAEFLVENKAFLEVLEEGGEGASAFAVFMAKRF